MQVYRETQKILLVLVLNGREAKSASARLHLRSEQRVQSTEVFNQIDFCRFATALDSNFCRFATALDCSYIQYVQRLCFLPASH